MTSGFRRPVGRWGAASVLGVLGAGGCVGPQNMLAPGGPAAARVEELWWVFFVMGVAVSVVVAGLLLMAIQRGARRGREQARRRGDGAGGGEAGDGGGGVGEINGNALVWIGAGAITPIVLFALAILSFRAGVEVYPPVSDDPDALTVEVVGHQYWWEIRYPEHGVVTANEIHIPVGRRVRILATGRDVIHSFWVPQLQGKIDLLPGHTTRQWLEADEPGRFRGQCAEYCGESHALMAFWVFAVPEEEFTAWIDHRSRPAPEPGDSLVQAGRQVFLAAECHVCHASRGIEQPEELGEPGPDLTHVASRATLAAGTLPNTRGSLAGWIADPQGIKPGTRMPPSRLPSDQMRALLAYLESLR